MGNIGKITSRRDYNETKANIESPGAARNSTDRLIKLKYFSGN